MNDKNVVQQLYIDKLVGKVIEEVKLYVVNSPRFDVKDCDRQVVDGAIEIKFEDSTYFCFGWDMENELLNVVFDKFEKLCDDEVFIALNIEGDYYWNKMLGQHVEKLDFEWTRIEYDNDLVHYLPSYIEFELSFNRKFLISTMQYEIRDGELINFEYDPTGWIFVFFDEQEILSTKEMLKEV